MTTTTAQRQPRPWPDVAPALLLVCSLLAGLAACGAPGGDAEAGRRWYAMARCDSCHGDSGRGGLGQPPALAGTALSYRQFHAKVRRAGNGIMPSISPGELSDQQLADMYHYLRGENPLPGGARP